MAIGSPYAQKPLTLDDGGDPGEMEFDANVGAPADTSAANVWKIEQIRSGRKLEVHKTWQFKGRIEGAAADDAQVTVIIWCFDRDTGEKYPIAKQLFVGKNHLSETLGNSKDLAAVLGTDYVGAEVIGLPADHSLFLVHRGDHP